MSEASFLSWGKLRWESERKNEEADKKRREKRTATENPHSLTSAIITPDTVRWRAEGNFDVADA